jgi:transcriptional regulator with XRE-family HTH domain
VSELLGRVCSAFRPEGERGAIVDAYLGGDVLSVRGPKQRMLHVPVASIPALRNLPRAVLRDFRIDPDGSFIHWPGPDVHLGWKQFLQAADPLELHRAQQRSADFNCRYGAAIRKLREEAGIPQAKVEGITERQLRRIEQGDCRATANALRNLARSRGIARGPAPFDVPCWGGCLTGRRNASSSGERTTQSRGKSDTFRSREDGRECACPTDEPLGLPFRPRGRVDGPVNRLD